MTQQGGNFKNIVGKEVATHTSRLRNGTHWDTKSKSDSPSAIGKSVQECGSVAGDGSSVMPLVHFQLIGRARLVGRVLNCVVVPLLFACGVVHLSLAGSLRTLPLHGVYATHDEQLLQA